MVEQTSPRLTLKGVFTHIDEHRNSLYLQDADGVGCFWWVPYALEHADQIEGWDWLAASVESGRIRLQENDAQAWARGSTATLAGRVATIGAGVSHA